MTEPPIVRPPEPPVVEQQVAEQQVVRQPTGKQQPVVSAAGKASNGQQSAAGAARAMPAPASTKAILAGYMHKRWAVLLLLFGATAALGLPILWKSRGFSLIEKIVWSILVSLYTVLVFWIFFKVMWWSYTSISESLR